jgi:hypothetical protein
MSDQPTMPTEQDTVKADAARKPYYEQFADMSNTFCTEIIREVPELHGIAIVPIWEVKPESTTAGYLRLKNPDMPYLASLLKLLGNLAAFNVEVHKDLINQLRVFDDYAGQLSSKIQELTGQLKEIESGVTVDPTPQDTQHDGGENK